MAKYSLENLRRVSRRETATNLELLVDDDDGAKTPLQINTIPQLKAWMAKDPREVLLAIQTFRQHDQAATAEFNEVNDKIDELRTAYDEQANTKLMAELSFSKDSCAMRGSQLQAPSRYTIKDLLKYPIHQCLPMEKRLIGIPGSRPCVASLPLTTTIFPPNPCVSPMCRAVSLNQLRRISHLASALTRLNRFSLPPKFRHAHQYLW